jgi:3-oxoisoapionate kinase
MSIRLGWYGDDFTGATDTLATLSAAGLRAMLFLGVPEPTQLAACGPLDAIGIAGAARSMAPDAMEAALTLVGRFFAGSGATVLHYKCCSTFDSAPQIGSIGTAARCLRAFMPNPFVPILGGQPSIGRFCVFSTVFAASGQGGAVHRLDRHPTMAHHPVTPMHEADLRRHLRAQGLTDIAAVHYPAYQRGLDGITAELDGVLAGSTPSAVVFDVARPEDLPLLGALLWRHAALAPLLAVGPSSVAQALVADWGAPHAATAPFAPAQGPVFAFVGSLSPVTRTQVTMSRSYVHFELAAADLSGGSADRRMVQDVTAALRAGQSVMVRTGQPAGPVASVAQATGGFIRQVVDATCVRRIGIAGGDTSSEAALAMGIWGLAYDRTLEPGVTLCRTRSDTPGLDGLELMLKGGQMGSPGLFETLLHGDRLQA